MLSRKLQVFISSTYNDLRAERQAAVEAILGAGHIPAGMELFAAGDQSQMQVIRRWIDESDVLLLILAGRYGSVEPTTGKSYTQLEYEYALEIRKPVFAVVVRDPHQEERVRALGMAAVEQDHPQRLRDFRELVQQRLVRHWGSPIEIKLAIHETMAEFSRRAELVGWVRGDRVEESSALLEEITRLSRESKDLRTRLSAAESASGEAPLPLDGMEALLRKREIIVNIEQDSWLSEELELLGGALADLGGDFISELHLLWAYRRNLAAAGVTPSEASQEYFKNLAYFGLLTVVERQEGADFPGYSYSTYKYHLSGRGRALVWKLDLRSTLSPTR